MKVRKEAGQILTDRSESPAQPRGIPETTRSGSSYPCNEQVRPSMTSAFCPLISPPPPSALSIAPPSSYPQAREANRREHPGTPHPCLPSSLPHPQTSALNAPRHIPSVLLGFQLCTYRSTLSVPARGSPTLCAGVGRGKGETQVAGSPGD